ncbi:MAG: hypothetical protein GXO40_03310, partial [Epsilonproteobacteria bacterium]|nr:hypothetical protein [Campylobacterota bacterium]
MRWLIFLLPLFVLAIPSLDEVLRYPKSYYRDFWLTQYLKEANSTQALKIYNQITYKKDFHLKILSHRNKLYKQIYNCKHINKHNWFKYPDSCITQNGFKLKDLKSMDIEDIKKLLNYLPPSQHKKEIAIIFDKKYSQAYKNNDIFYDIFLNYTPDVYIPPSALKTLSKDKRFKTLLAIVVRSKRKTLKKSLLNVSSFIDELDDRYKFD